MTRGLAMDAVTVTEHAEVAVPVAASVQLDPGLLKVSVGTDEEKETVPVGAVAAPGDVLTTVAVTVTGSPTAAEPFEREIDAEAEVGITVTVRLAAADVPWWTALPA